MTQTLLAEAVHTLPTFGRAPRPVVADRRKTFAEAMVAGAIGGHLSVVQALLAEDDGRMPHYALWEAFRAAVEHGHQSIAAAIVDAAAEVIPGYVFGAALCDAVKAGRDELATWLQHTGDGKIAPVFLREAQLLRDERDAQK